MVSVEGVFPEDIPAGALVPHWAYIKPSDYGGSFDVNASKLIGDNPESSPSGGSSTSYRSATTISSASLTGTSNPTSTPTSSRSGGAKKSSTNGGAIAGGVVGGLLGLALLGVLGFFIYKRGGSTSQHLAGPGPQPANPSSTGVDAGGMGGDVVTGIITTPNMYQYSAVPRMSPSPAPGMMSPSSNQSQSFPMGTSRDTGTLGSSSNSGGYAGYGTPVRLYDPSNPTTYPTTYPSTTASSQHPRSPETYGDTPGSRNGTPNPEHRPAPGGSYHPSFPQQSSFPQSGWGGYSGVPEV